MLRPTSPQRPKAIPTDTAAIALNSGPTTIAPTTRIAESVITAIAARMTASTRKTRYDTVGWAPSSASSADLLPDHRVVGMPRCRRLQPGRGGERCARRGLDEDAAALVETQLVEVVQHLARLLAGDVGLDQVAHGVEAAPRGGRSRW